MSSAFTFGAGDPGQGLQSTLHRLQDTIQGREPGDTPGDSDVPMAELAATDLMPQSFDEVTGAGDRAALRAAIDVRVMTNQPMSIVLFDLDEFRVINDSLGHDFGDRMLRAAAKRLSVAFEGQLYRPSGDEFAVILPSEDPEALAMVAGAVLDRWRKPLIIDGAEMYGGITAGIVVRQPDHRSSDDVLRDAEIALYRAKDLGRNRFEFFTPALRAAADEELSTQLMGRRAVVNKEFHLHWQPVYSTDSGSIEGLEALLRWRPAGGASTLSAAEFVPFLERSGLITPVGMYVIEEACRQYSAWASHKQIHKPVPIHINISRRQLLSGTVVDTLLGAIEQHGVPANDVVLEVPVSSFDDSDHFVGDLTTLRDKGVRIGLDDFGGRNSPLASLVELPIDTVKIDRSAARRISVGADEPIIDAMQSVIASQGLGAVVGGVETGDQLVWLRRKGWASAQGFHLAKPMSADDITSQLIRQR